MGRKVAGGRAVKATVPVSTEIVQGNFYLLDGFLGMALQSVTTVNTTSEVLLDIEPAEYETTQIDAADDFGAADKVYWDADNKRFTTEAGNNLLVGVVTVPKDAGDVIWFKYHGFALSGTAMPQAAAVADAVAGAAQGAQATLGTGVEGNNNAITWTGQRVGAAGNNIEVELVDPGEASQALAVAVDGNEITVNLATDTGTAATGTTGAAGDNNGLTWTAKSLGVAGNNIVIALEDPDAVNQELAVDVMEQAIVVRLATGGDGAITTTATQVVAAIENDDDADALVDVANTGVSTGAALVVDEVCNLAAGADPAVSSTATQVMAAVADDPEAAALVSISGTGISDGTGIVAAAEKANLTGGVDSEGQTALATINALLASMRVAGLMAE